MANVFAARPLFASADVERLVDADRRLDAECLIGGVVGAAEDHSRQIVSAAVGVAAGFEQHHAAFAGVARQITLVTDGGDFRVVSANENDTVDITDAAVIGGETELGLGEQEEYGGCHGGRGLAELVLNGRRLGFYYRGFRR